MFEDLHYQHQAASIDNRIDCAKMKPSLKLNARSVIVPKSCSLAQSHGGSHPSSLPYPFKPVHPPLLKGLRGTLQFRALILHRCSHLARGLMERKMRGFLDRHAPRKYKVQTDLPSASLLLHPPSAFLPHCSVPYNDRIIMQV